MFGGKWCADCAIDCCNCWKSVGWGAWGLVTTGGGGGGGGGGAGAETTAWAATGRTGAVEDIGGVATDVGVLGWWEEETATLAAANGTDTTIPPDPDVCAEKENTIRNML